MEHKIYIAGIKKALKARGLTYQDLADHLKMSESGVKKMLTGKDLSFRRLLQICECLDILPGALLALAEKSSIQEITLRPAQEEALLKNPGLLMVFWCVAIEKKSLREIEKAQKISAHDLKKLLNRLVTLGLLIEKKGIYRAIHTGKYRWNEKSALTQHLNKEWSLLTLQRSLASSSKNKSLQRLVTTAVSAEAFEQFKNKTQELLNELVRTSEREENQGQKSALQNVSAVVALVPAGIYDPFAY